MDRPFDQARRYEEGRGVKGRFWCGILRGYRLVVREGVVSPLVLKRERFWGSPW